MVPIREIRRETEFLVVGVLKTKRHIAVLQEEVQLAEDLCHVAAIDLVNQENVGPSRLVLGPSGELTKRPVHEFVSQPPVAVVRGRYPSTKSS